MKKFTFLFTALCIAATTSFSQGWINKDSDTEFILYGMSFPPGQNEIGYAAGMQYTYDAPGVIVKTTDAGETWETILPTSGEIDGLQAICFISETTGFAGGWNNYFIKTTDGGETWTDGFVNSNIWYFTDIEFWDENNGVASAQMNSGQPVFVTNDGGNTWTQASGLSQVVFDLDYADQNTVYAVGNAGMVSRSTDGGYTWNDIYSLGGGLSFGIDFYNADFGVVGGEDGKIVATTDGGDSWSVYTTGYHNFWAVQTFDENTAYVGGTDEDIYVTNDGGLSWSMEHNGMSSSTLYKIKFTTDNTGFSCGSQGKMLKKSSPFIADFYADQTEVCENDTVYFYNNSSAAATSWEWTFEGGNPESSTEENPMVIYNTAGAFDVELSVSDGSTTAELLMEDYILVANNPTPFIEGAEIVCDFQEEEYATTLVDGNAYAWEVVGGTIIDGEDTHMITVAWGGEGNGLVVLTEVNSFFCSSIDSLEVLIDDCTSITEPLSGSIKVNPNPAKDYINISFENISPGSFDLTIVNSIGQVVYQKEFLNTTANQLLNIDVEKLESGLYILKVSNKDGYYTRDKFIKK